MTTLSSFTLQWEPFSVGLHAVKGANAGPLDGRTCAAFIEYTSQVAAQEQWETSLSRWWALFPALVDLRAELEGL